MSSTTRRADPATRPPRRRAAAAAATAFIGMACFQAALALGAPLGNAAWGGAQAHLATGFASPAVSASPSGSWPRS